MTYIALDYLDLALAAILVVINGALSLALRLGVERQLMIATLRMIVQLSLVGLVLTTLFSLVSQNQIRLPDALRVSADQMELRRMLGEEPSAAAG